MMSAWRVRACAQIAAAASHPRPRLLSSSDAGTRRRARRVRECVCLPVLPSAKCGNAGQCSPPGACERQRTPARREGVYSAQLRQTPRSFFGASLRDPAILAEPLSSSVQKGRQRNCVRNATKHALSDFLFFPFLFFLNHFESEQRGYVGMVRTAPGHFALREHAPGRGCSTKAALGSALYSPARPDTPPPTRDRLA